MYNFSKHKVLGTIEVPSVVKKSVNKSIHDVPQVERILDIIVLHSNTNEFIFDHTPETEKLAEQLSDRGFEIVLI